MYSQRRSNIVSKIGIPTPSYLPLIHSMPVSYTSYPQPEFYFSHSHLMPNVLFITYNLYIIFYLIQQISCEVYDSEILYTPSFLFNLLLGILAMLYVTFPRAHKHLASLDHLNWTNQCFINLVAFSPYLNTFNWKSEIKSFASYFSFYYSWAVC